MIKQEQISNLLSDQRWTYLSHEKKKKLNMALIPGTTCMGQMIFLLNPGWQIEPCDMGLKACPACTALPLRTSTHFASFISSAPVENPPGWVGDYFRNMKSRIDEYVHDHHS